MIERRRNSLPPVPELLRDLLDFRPRRHEYGHTAPLTQDPLHEAIVQELKGLLGQHAHVGRPRRIERPRLEHVDRCEVARVERGVHGRGQPDEPTARALPERQAQLELG